MIGLQILERQRAISPEEAIRFLEIPVANISDCMARLFAAGPLMRPMHDGTPMSGAALTVRTRPGDNLMVHKALDMARTGDVIVVDGGGDLSNALIGEIMSSIAMHRGVAGLVIHGSIRDARALRLSPFPVFALGVTHRGPYKDGPGEINVPISLGGMVIHPGDLVVGDGDGVVAIPFDQVESIRQGAHQKMAQEQKLVESIKSGLYKAPWVDQTLERLGVVHTASSKQELS